MAKDKKIAYIVTNPDKSQELFLEQPERKFMKVAYSNLAKLKSQIKKHNQKLQNAKTEPEHPDRFNLSKFSRYYQLDISKYKLEDCKLEISRDGNIYEPIEIKAQMILPRKVYLKIAIEDPTEPINKVIFLD